MPESRRPVSSPRLVLLALAFVVLLPGFASAESGDDAFSRSGLYVGLRGFGATYSVAEDTLQDALPGAVRVDVDDLGGLAGTLGVRVSNHFALEAQFDWLATSEISATGLPAFAEPELDSVSATLNAKFYAATGTFQPYVRVGAGVMNTRITIATADESFTGGAGRFGAGAEIYVSENIAFDVGVDYLLPGGDVEDLDYVSYGAGFVWRP